MIDRAKALQNLRAARWVRDADTQNIFKVLDGLADKTRVVGGAVRDTLMGRYTIRTDLDLATELLPQEVIARAKEAGFSYYPTGIKHGTVTLRSGQTTVEVTTLRKDVKTDGRHAEVIFGRDWIADASRRDFTVNALYASMNGVLYDPLDALSDLLEQRVNFIGDPAQRIAEDYLRVYRFFRFTAGYGEGGCDPDALVAVERAADKLGHLSAERVGAEMMKILSLQVAAPMLAQMKKSGILHVSVPTLIAWNAYEQLSGSPVATARLAIMLCDQKASDVQKMWRLSNATIAEAQELCVAAKLAVDGKLFELAYRHYRTAPTAICVCASIMEWDREQFRETIERFREIVVPEFPLSGQDLIDEGVPQGPQLGKALHRIELDWVESGFEMNRERLMRRLQAYLAMPY